MTRKYTSNARGGFRKFLARTPARLALGALAASVPALAVERSWNTGNGLWGSAGNWNPVGFIGFGDSARVGNLPAAVAAQINMDVNVTCQGLTVEGQAHVNTNTRTVVVNGTTRLDGNTPSNVLADHTQLIVTNGAAATDLDTDVLQIAGDAVLRMVNAPTISIGGPVTTGSDALLWGNGTVNAAGSFSNSGQIRLTDGDMTINVTGGNNIDLDGTGDGDVFILDPNRLLTINAQGFSDAFDGMLYIGDESTVTINVNGSWSIGADGNLVGAFLGSQNVDAMLQGSPLTFGGELWLAGAHNTLRMASDTINISSTAIIGPRPDNVVLFENPTTIVGGLFDLEDGSRARFEDTTIVNGGDFQIDAGARVEFNGPTTMNGGTFTGGNNPQFADVRFDGPTTWAGNVSITGAAQQDGTATVNDPVVINADYFDLDGINGTTTVWNINDSFVLNTDHVELATYGEFFNGTLNIAGGLIGGMTINLADASASWTMAGVANLSGDLTLFPTRIGGSPMLVTGDINLTSGRAQITAPTTIDALATVNLPAASTQLRLNARSQIEAGATFTGPGLLLNGAVGTMRLDDGVATDQVGLQNRGDLLIADGGAGVATVNRYEQVAGASWRVSLGGDAGGSEHDLMVVSGPAVLAGALEVEVFNIGNGQFAPQVGDEFTILTAGGGVTGTFDANPISCAENDQYNWTVVYEPNEVTLQLTSITAGHLGDMNCDCFLTVGDIGGFVMALTNPAGFDAAFPDCSIQNADVNQDGFVTVGDIGAFVTLLTQ